MDKVVRDGAVGALVLLLIACLPWLAGCRLDHAGRTNSLVAEASSNPNAGTTVPFSGNSAGVPARPPTISATAGMSRAARERYWRKVVKEPAATATVDRNAIGEDDVSALISLFTNRFKSGRKPADFGGLLPMLAMTGGERAVNVFTNALIRDNNGRSLNEEQDADMLLTLRSLGMLASKHTSALQFLTAGTTDEFWRTHRKWKCHSDELQDTERRLVSISIVALGESGRPEAREHILRLAHSDTKYVYQFDGAIVTAISYLDYVRSNGLQAFMQKASYTVYVEWRETEQGIKWTAWSDAIRKGKSAPPPTD